MGIVMKNQFTLIGAAVSGAAMLMISGCGGGGDTASATLPAVTPAALTAPVTTRVVDGVITGAVVCIDTNENGLCDDGEVRGTTDSNGYVTLAVPVGNTHPLIATVGTDASDADDGGAKIKTPYTMSTPAPTPTSTTALVALVSPLTTLVQQFVANGATTDGAESSVKELVGSSIELYKDFTAANGDPSARSLARLIVATTQAHSEALKGAVVAGTPTLDGTAITQIQLDKAIQKKVVEQLPALVAALPAILSAADPDKKKKAIADAARDVVTSSDLTIAALPLVVAAAKAAAEPVVAAMPTAGISISGLNFTTASNYFTRLMTASIAQNTPDTAGNTHYVERRTTTTGVSVAQWGAGATPSRNADLHWNGTKWVNCPLNFPNTSGPRDAQGTNVYNYCDGTESGTTTRTSLDIGGQLMTTVYAQLIAAGDKNLTISDPSTALVSAKFPAGAKLTFQSTTTKTGALAYSPGSSNQVKQYSADVAAGVNSATGCLG